MFEEYQIGLPGQAPWKEQLATSGLEMQWVGAALSIGGAIVGGISGHNKRKSEEKSHNKAVDEQYKQDKKVHKYQWKQTKRAYEHQKDEVANAERNNRNQVKFQNETSKQNWKHSLAIDDYQWQQQKNAYAKSHETYEQQLDFNTQAADVAIESVDNVLGEKFLKTAFDNQQLINDYTAATGEAKFNKAQTALGLQKSQNEAGYDEASLIHKRNNQLKTINKQKENSWNELRKASTTQDYGEQKTKLEAGQKQADLTFAKADAKLNFEDAIGNNKFTKAESIQALEAQRASTGIAKAGLGLDLKQSQQEFAISQKKNSQALNKLRAEQAFESDNLSLKALEQKGQARLNQAGVSSAASVVSILSSLGQQQTAIIDSMVREGDIAITAMQEAASAKDLAVGKAGIEGAQLDQELFDNVAKAKLTLNKADNDLSIQGKKADLDIGKVDQNISDVADMADLDIKASRADLNHLIDGTQIEQDMYQIEADNARESAAIDKSRVGQKLRENKSESLLKDAKVDWSLLNDTNKLQLNQQILSSMMGSAVKQAKTDKKKIGTDKYQASIIAKANLMLKPTRGPKAPKPIDLPYAKFVDPLKPKKPPKPKKGAQSTQGGGGVLGTIGSMMSAASGLFG